MRDLDDEDRGKLLDTMQMLWTTDGDRGRELYGRQFKSATEVTALHAFYAADRTCDHLHDGLGFLTQHAALTLTFEQSLQSIHPRVSLPFW